MQRIAEILQLGKRVSFKPKGNSMAPLINSGDLVSVEPIELQDGDVVLCKVRGNYLLHKVTAKDDKKGFQISNNKGDVNGWTRNIYGKVILK